MRDNGVEIDNRRDQHRRGNGLLRTVHTMWELLERTHEANIMQYELDIPGITENCMENAHTDVDEFTADIELAHRVLRSGVPNRFGCQIPVKSNWNVQLMESLLHEYEDKEVVNWLRYGFSISREDTINASVSNINHKGATDFPSHVDAHVQSELKWQAIIGPFKESPFKQ